MRQEVSTIKKDVKDTNTGRFLKFSDCIALLLHEIWTALRGHITVILRHLLYAWSVVVALYFCVHLVHVFEYH